MKRFLLLVVAAVSLIVNTAYGGVDVYNIDSIDRLYVKDAALALKRLAVLRQRCERNGWKECSKAHLETIESLSHQYRGDVRNAQRHALAAIASSGSEDMFWKLMSYQTLCNTLSLDGNWALLGKYSQLMDKEAKLASEPWYIAQAELYAALADGYSGKTDKALTRMDRAVETYNASCKKGDKTAHANAIILYCSTLEEKIDLCMKMGKDSLAERFITEELASLDNDEKTGDTPMDRAGFDISRMTLYAKRAKVYMRLGKDGEPWCQRALVLLKKYPDNVDVLSLLADYLYATRRYSTYEKTVAPQLSNMLKREPDNRSLRMVWQWIDILSKTGRADSVAVWTAWGMNASDNLLQATYKNAEEGFTLAYKAETQKAELRSARYQLVFFITLAVFLLVAVVFFVVLWRKQKRDKHHLVELINESQKKEELNERLMVNEKGGLEASDSQDIRILSQLHEILTADGMFRKSEDLSTYCCRELGVSLRKLNAVLQKTRGVTLSAYIRDLRLDYACHLLREKPLLTVEAVALESGYNSLRPFLQAFKSKYNITPTAYRKGNIGNNSNID